MNIAIFIPVRRNSTRLPDKHLLKIKKKTVIEHLIARVKTTKYPNLIVLCTTKNREDERFIEIAKKNNVECFRGSEKDILKRYMDAAMKYNIDFIVNVDGDDILCEPEYIDKVIERFMETHADFIKVTGLPFGTSPCGIRVEALKKVCEIKNETNTETGWSRYFTEINMFKVEEIQAEKDLTYPNIRMTLDYPEDYKFFKEIFNILYKPDRIFTLRDVIKVLKENPEIESINRDVHQLYLRRFKMLATKIKFKKR